MNSVDDPIQKFPIGGQAVIEGVMMRGKNLVATAVRKSDGAIDLRTRRVRSISDRFPIFKLPFLRGSVSLFESMSLGMKSLSYSAQVSGEDEEQLTDSEVTLTIILAISLSVGIFVVLPTLATDFFAWWTTDPFTLNLMEGLLRLGIFLTYLTLISQTKDIHRLLQYHGAEHQTINCYESGEELTVENARRFSRLHPRCGTTFLLLVMLVSIFVFAFLGWEAIWIRISTRILLLPIVAGISYELIRAKNPVIRFLTSPGMLLQYLTTRSPDDEMLEVAIKALNAVKY